MLIHRVDTVSNFLLSKLKNDFLPYHVYRLAVTLPAEVYYTAGIQTLFIYYQERTHNTQ